MLHFATVWYLAASQHRRITTYEFEFPELCDERLNVNVLTLCHCLYGRVLYGWPSTRLEAANRIQIVTGAATAVCIVAQACVGAETDHQINGGFAIAFVAFAVLHLSTALRMQLTLNVIPSQDVGEKANSRSRSDSGSEVDYTEEYYIPYQFDELPLRLQLKFGLGFVSLACLVAFVAIEFGDLIGNDKRNWVLPLLQYGAILFYFGAYVSFAFDIRTSGITWGDSDPFEDRWRERLLKRRTVMHEQALRASSDPVMPESPLPSNDSMISRACTMPLGGDAVPNGAATASELAYADDDQIEIEMRQQGVCTVPAPRECGGDGVCAVQ